MQNHSKKYLTSVAADLAVKFETEAYVRSKIENVLKTAVSSVCHTNDVVKVIKDFQNKSSIGHHGISNEILKLILPIINFYIADLINLSVLEWTFPERLKVAKKILLHKPGAKSDRRNYRPISLLSSTSKFFEEIFNKRMLSFIKKYKRINQA